MKISPSANYSVRVRPREWEEPPETAAYYRGILAVALNHLVDITFVPDTSRIAPPWDYRMLPDDIDTVDTPELARLAAALFSSYVVTPNDRLAGSTEVFDWPAPAGMEDMDTRGVIFYVTAEEFARFATELDQLTEIADDLYSRVQVDDVRDREVIAFIERRVVASPLLKPSHAEVLGQTR
jgi:hypothetical protein